MGNKALKYPPKVKLSLVEKFNTYSQKNATFEDFINEFLGQFLSPQTKKAYLKDLWIFFNFIKQGNCELTHPKDIQSFHFKLYRDEMIEKNLSSATINRRLVAIRSFVKWAVATKQMDHNPLDALRLPKVQTQDPTEAFTDEEVSLMINKANTNEMKGSAHKMMMILLFYLGLRRSELSQIKLKDFIQDRNHFILKIIGKGEKIRLLPLNDTVRDEIKNYLERLDHFGLKLQANDYLLQITNKKVSNKPIDGSTIFRMIQKYAKLCNISKRVSPHSCRATVISHLLDTQHSPIRDVASFAGHANITTTERYDKRRNDLKKSPAYKVKY